jgi:hypothetical protein|tara:strand:- start:19 stop:129 length:111 start_codon:yes stop_codon:yes gene_type:complete
MRVSDLNQMGRDIDLNLCPWISCDFYKGILGIRPSE